MAESKAIHLFEGLLARRGVRQFVKFCLVGATSTCIDFGILWLLLNPGDLGTRLHQLAAGWPGAQASIAALKLHIPVAASVSFLVAVSNGFVWNSRWTFRGYGRSSRRRQYVKFLLVNLVGYWLNIGILTLVAHATPAALAARLAFLGRNPEALLGKAVATGFVVFWNFGANKYWTFAGQREEGK